MLKLFNTKGSFKLIHVISLLRNYLKLEKLTADVFLFGSRRTENSPSFSLVSLYSFVGRLGVYSA